MARSEDTRSRGGGVNPVDFAERFTSSELFDKVFREGMGLVEETANYLDGQGRKDSEMLSRPASLAYATESMRLTTRLMQLASWLLLQRAVRDGEMTQSQAHDEKYRIKLEQLGLTAAGENNVDLPDMLEDLILRSLALHKRIIRLDHQLRGEGESGDAGNPVSDQVAKLKAAFSTG